MPPADVEPTLKDTALTIKPSLIFCFIHSFISIKLLLPSVIKCSVAIAIACHDYGFDLTACELDKDYYDAAVKRLQQHQSQTKLF